MINSFTASCCQSRISQIDSRLRALPLIFRDPQTCVSLQHKKYNYPKKEWTLFFHHTLVISSRKWVSFTKDTSFGIKKWRKWAKQWLWGHSFLLFSIKHQKSMTEIGFAIKTLFPNAQLRSVLWEMLTRVWLFLLLSFSRWNFSRLWQKLSTNPKQCNLIKPEFGWDALQHAVKNRINEYISQLQQMVGFLLRVSTVGKN